MYRVIDVADMLGVSKVTIYKKIKMLKPGILSEIIEDDNVTYLTDSAVIMIRNSIKRKHSNQKQSDKMMEFIEVKIELDKMTEKLAAERHKIESLKVEQFEELVLMYRTLEEVLKVKNENLNSLIKSANSIKVANDYVKEQINVFTKFLQMRGLGGQSGR